MKTKNIKDSRIQTSQLFYENIITVYQNTWLAHQKNGLPIESAHNLGFLLFANPEILYHR